MNLGATHALAEICRVRHRVLVAFARVLTVKEIGPARKSNHIQCKCEPDRETHSGCNREQGLVPVAPRQKLEHQEPHAARQMRGEQQYETGLGKLDQRLLAPAQETSSASVLRSAWPRTQK
jgi:hypothetical protein